MSQRPIIFGQQKFGNDASGNKLYFARVSPATLLRSMLEKKWQIQNPTAASVKFLESWFDPAGNVIRPLQISCLKTRAPHQHMSIGADSKPKIVDYINCIVWSALKTAARTMGDTQSLHQNMLEE